MYSVQTCTRACNDHSKHTTQVADRRRGVTYTVADGGASGSRTTGGSHAFGWRDAMDVAVRWRQLAEPHDQVVWVDLLTRREFEAGFGSHTPMFSGQTKCVRYYMNFARALELHKRCLLEQGCAYDARDRPGMQVVHSWTCVVPCVDLMCGTIDVSSTVPIDRGEDRARIMAATTARDMYNVLRADCWVVVHIHSVLREKGGVEGGMEGTRLTLVADSSVPQGYEFSIRTPVTPARWALFDQVGCRVMQPSEAPPRIVVHAYHRSCRTALSACWTRWRLRGPTRTRWWTPS